MNEIIMGIYKLENLTTNEWYIGKSINVERRCVHHLRSRFKKIDGWISVILEECDYESLNEREKFHIANEKLSGGFCLNQTTGGSNGTKYSDASRAKISASLKVTLAIPEVKARLIAILNTPEVKARLSIAQKEAQNRPEVKAKKSAAAKVTMNRTDVREKRNAKAKEALNLPEVKAKISVAVKEAMARPNVKAKLIAGIKAANSRQKTIANRSAAQNRPEVKEKKSASLKATNMNPDVKAKRIAAQNRPEVKAKQKIAQNRPEVNEKRRTTLKATTARKREEKRLALEKDSLLYFQTDVIIIVH